MLYTLHEQCGYNRNEFARKPAHTDQTRKKLATMEEMLQINAQHTCLVHNRVSMYDKINTHRQANALIYYMDMARTSIYKCKHRIQYNRYIANSNTYYDQAIKNGSNDDLNIDSVFNLILLFVYFFFYSEPSSYKQYDVPVPVRSARTMSECMFRVRVFVCVCKIEHKYAIY